MRVLITGANGFIGKNLLVHLHQKGIETLSFTRELKIADLASDFAAVDFIFHLAGVNRPKDLSEFETGNTRLTEELCQLVEASGKQTPILYTSSIQADLENPYWHSKRGAEDVLKAFALKTNSPVYIYRLPNVFGKWSRPNYNSAVATFCHNIANNLLIQINDPIARISLMYIDDVISSFVANLDQPNSGVHFPAIQNNYSITVGELADQIRLFKESRNSLVSEAVGTGLTRALYSTYLSFLKPEQFAYPLVTHADPRGRFVEFLKTKDSGQFSFFTAFPGITRGGHYHHSKNEKFLVIQGKARFGFRHIVTGEYVERFTDGALPEVVETVPGWSHDITNIGDTEMIVMLWANEIFDRQAPDTISHKV